MQAYHKLLKKLILSTGAYVELLQRFTPLATQAKLQSISKNIKKQHFYNIFIIKA